jgi:hypothetical protein
MKEIEIACLRMNGPEWLVEQDGVEGGDYGVALDHNEKVGDVLVFLKGSVYLGTVFRHPACGEVTYTHAGYGDPPPLRKIALLQIMERFDDAVSTIKKLANSETPHAKPQTLYPADQP